MRRVVTVVTSLIATIGFAAMPVAAHAEGSDAPAFQTFPGAALYAIANPGVAPNGANDWDCVPSAAHPRPVVLVHGTWSNQFNSWSFLSPKLKAAGYCVFSLNYGKGTSPVGSAPEVYATGPIMDSARELGEFVERVRTETTSAKVDLVGYSQGGIVARGYLKFFGGADKVKKVVTYAATNHGTSLSGLGTLALQLNIVGVVGTLAGQAAADQTNGSAYITALNEGGDTMPGIDYTILTTRYDEVSTPYQASFLTAGPGATVNNIVIQDGCLIDGSDHLGMPFSLRAADYTLKALDPSTPRTIRCALELPAV